VPRADHQTYTCASGGLELSGDHPFFVTFKLFISTLCKDCRPSIVGSST
jgi:hypothetical protein